MIISPLIEELKSYWASESFSFHMPGHKGGNGISPLAHDILGTEGFRADVSEVGGFDYLHDPHGNLRLSQELAARVFGAKESFFLINGSTAGNIAALLSVVGDNDKILIPRMSHRSVFAGLALTGAIPIYIEPLYDSTLGGYLGMELQPTYEEMKMTICHNNIKAIFITRPSYYGLCNDIKKYLKLTRECQIPLIVDEAHGAHFVFHPEFPPTAMAQGADVAIQSIHKTLGSFTQSSILHLGSDKVSKSRLQQALNMIQSSSPSALLLLSLDITCSYLANQGQKLFARAVELAESARYQIKNIEGLYCYGNEILGKSGLTYLDRTKLIIDVSELKITGFEAAKWLKMNHSIGIELSDLRRIVCTITLGDSEESISHLIIGLSCLSRHYIENKNTVVFDLGLERLPNLSPSTLPLRKALLSSRKTVAIQNAIDEISAEYIVIYPPGIPLIAPGEVLTKELLEYLLQFRIAGGRITGLCDPTMSKIDIIER